MLGEASPLALAVALALALHVGHLLDSGGVDQGSSAVIARTGRRTKRTRQSSPGVAEVLEDGGAAIRI